MVTRLLTLATWTLVAASATFWALQVLARPAALPASARVAGATTESANSPLNRLLGEDVALAEPDTEAETPDSELSRLTLVGVVTPSGSPQRAGGLALISLDQAQPAFGTPA